MPETNEFFARYNEIRERLLKGESVDEKDLEFYEFAKEKIEDWSSDYDF